MHIQGIKNTLLISLLLVVFAVTAKDVSVDLVYPKQNQENDQLMLSGTIKSKQHANVSVLTPGVIEAIAVEAGQFVKQGDVLLTLNNVIAKSQLAQADAALNASDITYQESHRQYQEVIALSENQVVAKTLIAERKAAMAKAAADKSQASAIQAEKLETLNRHTLIAPFSGVITERFVEVGEWVTPQTSVLSLISANQLRLELAVPQEYFPYFKSEKLKVRITPDMQNTVPFEQTISQVISASNELTRTFDVYIDIDETHQLISGTSARASIALPQTNPQKIWLPSSALKHHPDGGYSVFSVTNNVAKRHTVDVLAFRGDDVAVFGAPKQLAYVINGVQSLKDNNSVVVNSVSGSAQ